MIVMIEYYKGDTLIRGKDCSEKELKKKFKESITQRTNYDEFTALFCRLHDFEEIPYSDYIYVDFIIDIDTDNVLKNMVDKNTIKSDGRLINYLFYNLDEIDAIRKRPGMYVGRVDQPGLYYLFFSLVEDLVLNCESKTLTIDISNAHSVKITGDSSLINCNLLSIKVACALSESFEWKDKYTTFRSEKGILKSALKGFLYTSRAGIREANLSMHILPEGFFLELIPDSEIFVNYRFDFYEILARLKEFSQLNNDITITLKDKTNNIALSFTTGIHSFFECPAEIQYFAWKNPIEIEINGAGVRGKILLMLSSFIAKTQLSFANDERVLDGGTHVDGLVAGLKKVLRKFNTLPEECPERIANIIDNMNYVITLRMENVCYAGAVRRKIVNPELKKIISDAVYKALLSRTDIQDLFPKYVW